MIGDRARRATDHPFYASQAEIDALGSVIAATVDLAERVRSEAASLLLRRALTLIQDRHHAPGEDAHGEGQPAVPEVFSPS